MHGSALFKGVGAAIALIGAWAALVAYVGPTFGYPMPPGSDQPAWDWSASHTWRHLLPGVAAVVGGVLIFTASRSRVLAGSLVALLAGIWMIISPFVVRAWLDGGGGGGGGDASTVMSIITPLGYHHVPGILTLGLSAFLIGRLTARETSRRDEDSEERRAVKAPPEERRERERERDEVHA